MNDPQPLTVPYLVAHRGLMKSCPENTRLSIEQAMNCGACFVEFDVQMTKDHQLVVIHDDTLNRTSTNAGCVLDMESKELLTVNVNEPHRFGSRFAPEPVIKLSDMMSTICSRHRVHAFVEVKEESLRHFGHETVMSSILSELDKYRHRSTIISFDHRAIQIALQQRWSAGWVLHKYNDDFRQLAQQLRPDYLICNHEKISPSTAPWQGKWKWMLYDITDPELALDYAARNVEFIETEDIASMLAHPVLKQHICNGQRHG